MDDKIVILVGEYTKPQYLNYSVFIMSSVHVVNENLILPSHTIFTYSHDFALSRKEIADRYIG